MPDEVNLTINGNHPIFTDILAEKDEVKQEKLVKKGKSFVEGVNQFIESPVQTTKQALSALAENPGKFIGESVKIAPL
jgi:hypothetical protein